MCVKVHLYEVCNATPKILERHDSSFDMTHMWQDSCVTWRVCDTTHVWYDLCVTWFIHMCDMTMCEMIRLTSPMTATIDIPARRETQLMVQGGVGCIKLSLSAKEPLVIGLFSGKWPVQKRHPMRLRHPVERACSTCDMAHVWHDLYATWLICDMAHILHDSYMYGPCVTWLIYM